MPTSAFFTAPTFVNLLPTLSLVVAAVGAVTTGSLAPLGAGVATSREMAATTALAATATTLPATTPTNPQAAASTTTLAVARPPPGGVLGVNSAKRQAMKSWIAGTSMMKILSPTAVLLLQLCASKGRWCVVR